MRGRKTFSQKGIQERGSRGEDEMGSVGHALLGIGKEGILLFGDERQLSMHSASRHL